MDGKEATDPRVDAVFPRQADEGKPHLIYRLLKASYSRRLRLKVKVGRVLPMSQVSPVHFPHWFSGFQISSEGKHVVEFQKDFPLTVVCYRYSFDFRLTQNYHDYFEISYIYEGKGVFRIGHVDFEISKGVSWSSTIPRAIWYGPTVVNL